MTAEHLPGIEPTGPDGATTPTRLVIAHDPVVDLQVRTGTTEVER